MQIVIGSTTLATNSSRTVGTPGMPSDVECTEETVLQESNPIRAARRILYARSNGGGSLSFAVRIEYSTMALCGAAAVTLPRAHRGLTGTLSVTPKGGTAQTTTLAHVKSVSATQTGCTLTVRYRIEF